MTPRPWYAEPDSREILGLIGIVFIVGCLVGFAACAFIFLLP